MSESSIAQLNANFALPGQLSFAEGPGGLIVAKVANGQAEAMIALSGGHVMTWNPRGERPVLWLSGFAKFAPGKSIRGGVPVCWPWFGNHATESSFPGHGFARTVPWSVLGTEALADGATRIRLRIEQGPATAAQWPHPSEAESVITVGRELGFELITRNLGDQAFEIGEALHTYFAVSDIRNCPIEGLDGVGYVDKVDDWQRKTQQGAIRIDGEVDRGYLSTAGDCLIRDPGWGRVIRIRKENANTTVVWNPGAAKAEKMGDFGPDGHLGMVCVESGNAFENRVEVPAGGTHRMAASYAVESLGG
jgi:glucose-6-phosphate 1-epimerase